MAKWGEGDPRWIVEERPDATNVNNWHWTEKNADSWSKQKLQVREANHHLQSFSCEVLTQSQILNYVIFEGAFHQLYPQ